MIVSKLQCFQLAIERIKPVWLTDLSTTAQAALWTEALNRQQYDKPRVAGEKSCYASQLTA